jgi:hypothetical protein
MATSATVGVAPESKVIDADVNSMCYTVKPLATVLFDICSFHHHNLPSSVNQSVSQWSSLLIKWMDAIAFINSLVTDSHQEIYFRGWVDLFYQVAVAGYHIISSYRRMTSLCLTTNDGYGVVGYVNRKKRVSLVY